MGGPQVRISEMAAVEKIERRCLDILNASVLAQRGVFEAGGHAPVFPVGGLAVDQQAEPFLEAPRGNVGRAPLVLEAPGHAGQAKRDYTTPRGTILLHPFQCPLLGARPPASLPNRHRRRTCLHPEVNYFGGCLTATVEDWRLALQRFGRRCAARLAWCPRLIRRRHRSRWTIARQSTPICGRYR